MEQTAAQPHQSSQASEGAAVIMGRLRFGGMYLELPIDDDHKANRKVLGVLGREISPLKMLRCGTSKTVSILRILGTFGARKHLPQYVSER